MRKLLLILGLVLLSTTLFSKSFIWEVEKGNSKMHLLGSIHVAKPELYKNGRLSESIMKAFEESKSVVVEADVTENSMALQMKVMTLGMYSDKTLENVLSKKTYASFKEKAASVGLPMMMVGKMKPWLAGLTVTLMKMQKLGYDPNYGIDLYFLKKSKCKTSEKNCKKKEVLELESGEFQMNLIASFEEKLDILNLELMLKDWDKMPEMLTKLFKDWQEGKTESLETFSYQHEKEYPELKVYYQKLLIDRNINMAKKLDKMLKTKGGNYFVIVGGGHLVGKDGLIDLLRKKGYKLTQK